MIVIVPHMVLERILDHAGSHSNKEVIGVLLGRTRDRIIEITDIVPYPEASYPERAVLPANFLYNTIGDEMRERGYQINVKGYYHSHPPDVFPLTFSQIDFTQYEEFQNIFARKQPFLAIIANPVSRKYVFLTLDVDKREISLQPFTYHNLTWIDYAVKRFSDGFSPYRVDPQTGEGVLHPEFKNFLDRLSQKYEQKKIVTIMLDNATKYRKILEKRGGKFTGIEELKEIFSRAKTHYYNEDYVKADTLLETFIKTYTEQVADKIEPPEEAAEPGESQLVTRINQKIHMLIKYIGRAFPYDSTRIAQILLDIEREIDELGEPFCHMGIDKTFSLSLPSALDITEDHLKFVEDIIDSQITVNLGDNALNKIENSLKPTERSDRVTFINQLLHAYFEQCYEGTREALNDEINDALILTYVKKGYTIKGLFFENLQLATDNLKEIFADNFQDILPEIENYIKKKIQKDKGTETLERLILSLRS